MREPSGSSSSRLTREAVDATDRAAARRALRDRRAGLPAAERARADASIGAALDALVREIAPASIAGFWPMHDEPELAGAYARWHAAGIAIALPRVVAAGVALEFGRWRPGAALARGPFGTRHPEPHEPLDPEVLLLPCLGFDARCFRLGYGGGFYDRTLAERPAARAIGVAYDDCEVTGFVAGAHDRPLERVVTDRRVLAPARPPR